MPDKASSSVRVTRRSKHLEEMKSTMGAVNISKESSINKKKAIQTQEKNEPLKRKRKVATGDNLLAVKKFKGKGKKVCNLREIPLEILFEILYLLTPSDLVNLSQAGKDFESMFRGPDSPTIWKEVRHNVVPALPPCPPDLNELEFAELLFGKCCHYCAKKIMPLHTVWEARQRICNQCVKQWCTTEIPKMQLKSITDLQNYVPSICTYSGHRGTHYYFATIIDDWRKAYNKSKAKAKWKTSKIQELEMIRQHAGLCRTWAFDWAVHKANEMKEMIKQRQKKIETLVNQLGRSIEVEKMAPNIPKSHQSGEVHQLCQNELTPKILTKLEA